MSASKLNIPEEFKPGLTDLPGELPELAEVIEQIAPGKGVDITLALAEAYRGTSVYFHNLDWLRRKIRNNQIIARYDNGERVPDIARAVNLSERQVWKILGKEPGEDKQLQLF